MARSHGRLATSIWADDDFTDLSEAEQRAYMLALSQPGVSYAGVLPYTLRRWKRLARDTSLTKMRKAFLSLQERRYVLIDETTEEVFLRTFLRWDGIMTNPNVAKASAVAYKAIHSPMLRGAYLVELHRMRAFPDEGQDWSKGWEAGRLEYLLKDPLPEGFPDPLLNHLPEWLQYARAAPAPSPFLTAGCEHGCDTPSKCALCRRGVA